MSNKTFALTGLAGYVAPRHLKAIQSTGNVLLAAMDTADAVGVIDRFFPEADFFLNEKDFTRYLLSTKNSGKPIDYLSICSPNNCHKEHISIGLKCGASVICEKPLTLSVEDAMEVKSLSEQTGCSVSTILQLRLHPKISEIKNSISYDTSGKVFDIDLTYITPRGKWYLKSWKADLEKSGGIATNIGIHLFDLLSFLFGTVKKNTVHIHTVQTAAGYMEFERARVRWFLSIDRSFLPKQIAIKDGASFRSLKIGESEFDFSEGFSDLHTKSYEEILAGRGFGADEVLPSIKIASDIRLTHTNELVGDFHPFCLKL